MSEKKELADVITQHMEFFNRADSKSIAQQICHAPVQFAGSVGHIVANTKSDVERQFEKIFDGIKKQGWVHSTLDDLDVVVFDGGLALADMHYTRLTERGESIPPKRRTTLYVLRRIDSVWRMVGVHSHDGENNPRIKATEA